MPYTGGAVNLFSCYDVSTYILHIISLLTPNPPCPLTFHSVHHLNLVKCYAVIPCRKMNDLLAARPLLHQPALVPEGCIWTTVKWAQRIKYKQKLWSGLSKKPTDFGCIDCLDSSKRLWMKHEKFRCFSLAGLAVFCENIKFSSSLSTAKASQKGLYVNSLF